MSKFCGNCGKESDDNAAFCTNCGNSLTEKIDNITENNTNVKKKVRFHWEIPFILFIQFIIVRVLYSIVEKINIINYEKCIDSFIDTCDKNSILMDIMNFISRFSTILCIFVFPSLVAVLIVYFVRKGKK